MTKKDLKQLKAVFDRAVRADRFSERSLFDQTESLRASSPVAQLNTELDKLLTPAELQIVHRRMTRAVYLIELVKGDVSSTKYDVRWTSRLASGDPRKVSFEECLATHQKLCREVLALLGNPDFLEGLKLGVAWGLSPHEFPIDYATKTTVPIHGTKNIKLLHEPEYLRLLKVRQCLLDPKLNPDFQLFAAIFDKVRVKSYLTDRALTGDYKTNREKRWEAHPESPQFALRRDCLAV